jgi:hypothetical protein
MNYSTIATALTNNSTKYINLDTSTSTNADLIYYTSTISNSNLVELKLPSTVTKVYIDSELNNITSISGSGVTDVYCSLDTPPTLSKDLFSNCTNLTNIYVQNASLSTYKSAAYWSNYSSKIISMTPFITEWTTTSDDQSITLPMYVSGTIYAFNCTIDWGDGTEVTTCTTATATTARVHTYATAGSYIVTITGICEAWAFNNISTSLTYITGVTQFGGNIFKVLNFSNCIKLSSLPSTDSILGSSITNLTNFFYNCNKLTSVPDNIFRYTIKITDLTNCFNGCSGLTSIPSDIFRYNTEVTNLSGCFYDCTSLTTIPTDIFRYNTKITDLSNCFRGCTSLTTIPSGIFQYNIKVNNFGYTFQNCSSLTTIPDDIFWYNTVAICFDFTFNNCIKLKLHQTIFSDTSSYLTRFAGKDMRFSNTFYRNSYSGIQGTAPELWNYTMTNGTSGCFGGAGNSATSLSNYSSIPSTWIS